MRLVQAAMLPGAGGRRDPVAWAQTRLPGALHSAPFPCARAWQRLLAGSGPSWARAVRHERAEIARVAGVRARGRAWLARERERPGVELRAAAAEHAARDLADLRARRDAAALALGRVRRHK